MVRLIAISGARLNNTLQYCSCGGVLFIVSLVLSCSLMNLYWLGLMVLMSIGLLLVVKSSVSWLSCIPQICRFCCGFGGVVVCAWVYCVFILFVVILLFCLCLSVFLWFLGALEESRWGCTWDK